MAWRRIFVGAFHREIGDGDDLIGGGGGVRRGGRPASLRLGRHDIWLEADTNGDGAADFQIVLSGGVTPVAADFIL